MSIYRLQVYVYQGRKNKMGELSDTLADLNNFNNSKDIELEVGAVTAELLPQYLKDNGFVEAEGWGTDNVLFNAKTDTLVEVNLDELKESHLYTCQEVLNDILSVGKGKS